METTVENPDLVDTLEADDRGRVNLGKRFSGATVRVAVEVIDTKPQEA